MYDKFICFHFLLFAPYNNCYRKYSLLVYEELEDGFDCLSSASKHCVVIQVCSSIL